MNQAVKFDWSRQFSAVAAKKQLFWYTGRYVSDSIRIQTHNQLVRKRTLNHLATLAK